MSSGYNNYQIGEVKVVWRPATIDLTEVKSKTLSLSYGYWNKNFGVGRTKLIIRFAKLSLNKSVLKLSLVKSLGGIQACGVVYDVM